MESHITHGQRWWLYALSALTIAFLVLPSLIVIPMSFSGSNSLAFPPPSWSLRWYTAYFGSSQWLTATWTSVVVALLTAAVSTPIGTAAAYSLHAGSFMWKKPIYGMLIASLTVPVILIAIGAYFAFAQVGLVNTKLALVLSDSLLAVPFVLVTVAAGLKGYDMNQEQAARSLGASRFTAFMTVTLPQIRSSVIAGAFFAFIVAFDEVVIASFLSGGEGATLTNLMFASLRNEIDPTIAAISTMLIVLTTIPPFIGHLVTMRRARASSRQE